MNPSEGGRQKRRAVFWLFVGREQVGGGAGVWRRGRGGPGVIRGGAGRGGGGGGQRARSD